MASEIAPPVTIRAEKDGNKNKFRTYIYGMHKYMSINDIITKFDNMKKKMGTSMQIISEATKKSGEKTKGKITDIKDPVVSFGGNDAERIKKYMVELKILQEHNIVIL
jgi:hypothetical protein